MMMMTDVEKIFGEFAYDNPNGKWFANKDKDGFVRYYSTDWREVVHSVEEVNEMGMTEDKWTVSIGYREGIFSKGHKLFNTVREAKEWCDNRDMIELGYLEEEVFALRKRWMLSQPKEDKKDEWDPGF